MAIAPKLELRASQSLVLTPQLQQAIKLLQMNAIDIETWVEQQIEENPFLEQDEEDEKNQSVKENSQENSEENLQENSQTQEGEESSRQEGEEKEQIEQERVEQERLEQEREEKEREEKDSLDMLRETQADQESLDVSYENVFDQGEQATRGKAQQGEMLTNDIEDETERSLTHHLQKQLGLDMQDEVERAIGAFFIDQLDENGFLPMPMAEAAKQLGCSKDEAEAVLKKLQQFEPPGLFARNLAETLKLQLQDQEMLTPALDALLADLDLLASGESETLRKRCALDKKSFEKALTVIRNLNPRPASAFDHRPVQTVVPDLIMREVKNQNDPESDIWHVELNNETLPRVLVNREYHAEISNDVSLRGDAQAQEFLKERWQSANWLTKALDQRAQTILKVAAEIVKRQRGFFRYGIAKLAPLVLRDIADTIGMHESTVSRVVNGKYMQTPRGMFELRYFFTKAIHNSIMHTSLSAKSVRYRIRQLINEEIAGGTLSDDKIVTLLKDEGVEIARRTVTKYREAMRIGSSVDRRRQQALRANR